ncbi:NUDIX domain protein [uncultured archaeon]|nr:NUDIX domain protein [uncultured archaeon]
MADFNKIAGIVIRDKKLLITRTKGETMFFALGGKMEQGETELECLQREVMEEISCETISPEYMETFEGRSHDNKKSVKMICYRCELKGTIQPCSEIEEIAWIDRDYKKKRIQVASMLELYVIPYLIEKGLL